MVNKKEKRSLEKNINYSEKFVQPIKNVDVPKEISKIIKENNVKSMVDLGCGDGALIHAIKKDFPSLKVTGIDISPRRINGLKEKFPEDKFYVKDVCNTELKEKFDFVHSSQVIEHVFSDKALVKEMSRLLKEEGILLCSSVIKRPGAIYIYRNNGRFVLDPTHEREYKDSKHFLNILKEDFKLISYKITKIKRKRMGITYWIPGYYVISGIWKKR